MREVGVRLGSVVLLVVLATGGDRLKERRVVSVTAKTCAKAPAASAGTTKYSQQRISRQQRFLVFVC